MDQLARYLYDHETITGKEFMKIFREAKGIPEPVDTSLFSTSEKVAEIGHAHKSYLMKMEAIHTNGQLCGEPYKESDIRMDRILVSHSDDKLNLMMISRKLQDKEKEDDHS